MPSNVTDELLDAIEQVESSGRKFVIGDKKNKHQAYGGYQMTEPAYKDVQRLYPKQFGLTKFKDMYADPKIQREAARHYLKAGEDNYGIKDHDSLIAFYNKGPSVKKTGIQNQHYVDKVKKHLKPTIRRFK